jgi:hypothetical protein
MRKVTLFFLSVIVSFTGCSSGWKITKPQYKNRDYGIETPPNWMITREGASTILSRHGPSLDRILIFRHKINEMFLYTTLKVYSEMLPHELGEVVLSRMVANSNLSCVKLIKESLAKINGKDAVKLIIDYQVNDIAFTDIVYSFVEELFLFEIRYTAVRRHYYEESYEVFEEVVRSFRMR